MRITVVGTGYVGLVTGVCLADTGNHVLGVDIDVKKVERLNRGECTIFEPGLLDLLQSNLEAGRFRVTTNLEEAVKHAEVMFIAIGTPPKADGSADLSAIEKAVQQIAKLADHKLTLVMKSTVPVGTGQRMDDLIKPLARHPITVVSNPEFLKEGSAVDDFQRPDRVVIGTDDPEAAAVMKELYGPYVRNQHPILVVKRAAAELVKYAANCYLATRISFINHIANLCVPLGIDIDEVKLGMAYDARIGFHFLYPGIGYGGSCFPKDVQALYHVAKDIGMDADLLASVHTVNERQKRLLGSWIIEHFSRKAPPDKGGLGGCLENERSSRAPNTPPSPPLAGGEPLAGKTFALWGVAFKPKTDDIREAPALNIINTLLEGGAKVRAHDPKSLDNLRLEYGERITYCKDAYETLNGADALVICTEWNEFRSPDFDRIKAALKQPVIFDGRNLFTPDQMRRRGFTYYSIGRPPTR